MAISALPSTSFSKLVIRNNAPSCTIAPWQAAKMAVHAQASARPLQVSEESDCLCKLCKARGWLVCDFCNGQKVNVKAKNNRMYRRCPSCKAAGVVLCPQCYVYKCVTFPDGKDGGFEL